MRFAYLGLEMGPVLGARCDLKILVKSARDAFSNSPPESTMYVVTFSGVTSGGIVTSGTTCWTCVGLNTQRRIIWRELKRCTCATNDSLMSEVTMVLFPTPSAAKLVGMSNSKLANLSLTVAYQKYADITPHILASFACGELEYDARLEGV